MCDYVPHRVQWDLIRCTYLWLCTTKSTMRPHQMYLCVTMYHMEYNETSSDVLTCDYVPHRVQWDLIRFQWMSIRHLYPQHISRYVLVERVSVNNYGAILRSTVIGSGFGHHFRVDINVDSHCWHSVEIPDSSNNNTSRFTDRNIR